MSKEAMKLARDLAHQIVCGDYDGNAQDVLEKLDEALAKQEQGEPVAWAEEIIDDFQALYDSEMIKHTDSGDELIRLDAAICVVEESAQRHTTPQQRKPLTDKQIKEALADMSALQMPFNKLIPSIARAIEAAHGIKGGA